MCQSFDLSLFGYLSDSVIIDRHSWLLLNYYLQVILPAAREEVWTILCEYLRIAEEGHPILKTEDFQNNVIFQPWIKVLITHTLATCKHIPSKLSIKQLQFLDRWCKLMVNNVSKLLFYVWIESCFTNECVLLQFNPIKSFKFS